jgi:hypothetical protein
MPTTQPSVRAPWSAVPGEGSTVAERLAWYVDVARLAPSKHNSQPWRFVLRDDALLLWPDLGRALPLTDPTHRELLLSCGAAVHLAWVAARSLGHELEIAWLPESGSTLLARLTEGPSFEVADDAQELLAAVASRRTDRGPLDATHLSAQLPFELQAAAFSQSSDLRLVVTQADRKRLSDLVLQADRIMVRSGNTDEELADWRRFDGDIRLDGVPMDRTRGPRASYRAEFVQRDFGAGAGTPAAMDRDGPDAALVVVLSTPGDKTIDWLIGGRALAAVLLQATRHGAHASYLNQPCEVEALRGLLRADLRIAGYPQVIVRIGVGGDVAPAPRRETRQILTQDTR